MRLTPLLVLCSLGAVSCNDGIPAPAPEPAAAAPADPLAAARVEAELAAKRATEPKIQVPGVALRPPSADAEREAEAINLQGMAAFNDKDYETAIDKFVQALETNPAAHQVRYNLACALTLSGDAHRALDLLQQLKDANCTACRDKLDRARYDVDLSSLRGHPRFEAIIAD